MSTPPKTPQEPKGSPQSSLREAKLAAALKRNLAKRKAAKPKPKP